MAFGNEVREGVDKLPYTKPELRSVDMADTQTGPNNPPEAGAIFGPS